MSITLITLMLVFIVAGGGFGGLYSALDLDKTFVADPHEFV